MQHNGHKIPKGYSEAVNRRIYNTMATSWYLVAIVLYILRFTASEYPFGILWPLCCISFGLRLLNTPLVSCGHCVVYPSVYGFWIPLWYHVAIALYILRFTASHCPFGILWPLCCISFGLRLLIVPLVSCDHCVVYPSLFRSRKPKDIQHNGHMIPKGQWEAVNRRIYNAMATRYQRGNQKP
jgi:hypothetical protein